MIADAQGDMASDSPVFSEPWQAEAFAIVIALHDRKLFTWDEWAGALSAQLKQPNASDDASDYYHRWLAALESLLVGKSIAGKGEIEQMTAAWHRAARATPHGKPIKLENDPNRI
jgi:nitrile hydratase accessory protein